MWRYTFYGLLHTRPIVEIEYVFKQSLRFLHRSLYRQRLMWTVTCWPCRTTCSSTTTQNMAEEPAALTPQKVRPLLIWRMVGTFPITLLFAKLFSLSPSIFLPFPFPFFTFLAHILLVIHIRLFSLIHKHSSEALEETWLVHLLENIHAFSVHWVVLLELFSVDFCCYLIKSLFILLILLI